MYIHGLDEHHVPAAQRTPALTNPILGDVAVYQDMQVGNAALVKFQNGDVFDGSAILSAQIKSELVEYTAQILYRVTLNFRRVQG